MKTLNIGADFSRDPAGRYLSDGEGNGEEFRESYLKPAIESLAPGEKLRIILDDGVESYGSSFLSEGFAGMVKFGYITGQDLLNKIEISYTNKDFEFYKNRIISYINDAKYDSEEYHKTKK